MKSREMALCGVLCALAAALLTLGGVIPAATFCAPVLAMAALLPVLPEQVPEVLAGVPAQVPEPPVGVPALPAESRPARCRPIQLPGHTGWEAFPQELPEPDLLPAGSPPAFPEQAQPAAQEPLPPPGQPGKRL